MVFGDSIAKRINVKKFNEKLTNANAQFKLFPGATSVDLNYYLVPTLEKKVPDISIIQVGANDVLQRKKTNKEIADDIINIGVKCIDYGVNDIIISSLTPNRSLYAQRRINTINDTLQSLCIEKGFTYVDQYELYRDEHLWKDGIHLNDHGKIILEENYINVINKSGKSRNLNSVY